MASDLASKNCINILMQDDYQYQRVERLSLDVHLHLMTCMLELRHHGWILLKKGMIGNPKEEVPTQSGPHAQNKYVQCILAHISRAYNDHKWLVSGYSQSNAKPDCRLLEVTTEAWKDPGVLIYNCFHLDHLTAGTQWVMEFMDGPKRQIGETMNIYYADAGDIFMVSSWLPRTNPQIRHQREARNFVQADYTADVKDPRFDDPQCLR